MEDLIKETVEFDQEKYEKNINENEFVEYDELDGFGPGKYEEVEPE